jgi:hypothetical protein
MELALLRGQSLGNRVRRDAVAGQAAARWRTPPTDDIIIARREPAHARIVLAF